MHSERLFEGDDGCFYVLRALAFKAISIGYAQVILLRRPLGGV